MKFIKNADSDKNAYSGYGGRFDSGSHKFRCHLGNVVKMFLFWLQYSSSRHPDNRKKNTIVFGEGLADGLYDTTKTAKAKYSVNITTSRKKICMSLHNITADIFCVLMA